MILASETLHCEYWITLLQSLGIEAPLNIIRHITPPWAHQNLDFSSTYFTLGESSSHGFKFEWEKSAHLVYIASFQIDSTLISNQEFNEFCAG